MGNEVLRLDELNASIEQIYGRRKCFKLLTQSSQPAPTIECITPSFDGTQFWYQSSKKKNQTVHSQCRDPPCTTNTTVGLAPKADDRSRIAALVQSCR